MSDYYWESDDRIKHMYIPGISGSGKTNLMANLVLGDLESQDGSLIVIDPKGSNQGLVERVIPHIPRSLIDKTFYISLNHPVPIDILNYRTPREKSYVRNDIIAIIKRFSFGSWGSTLQGTLNELIPTILEAQDATFLDIGAFLESKKRQHQILEQVSRQRREYWKENPPRSDVGPLLTRMSNFKDEPLRTIVGSKRGEGLSIAEIIEKNQILLVDTSPLSDDGLMVGGLIMSRIQQAIFRRSPDKAHPQCHVYADEFHNFITSAFSEMLSQSRSFNLSLCLGNQHPGQIKDIWDDIIGCVSSYSIFKLDGKHAAMLASKIKERNWKPPDIDKTAIRDRLKFLDLRDKYFDSDDRHERTSEERTEASQERRQNDIERLDLEDLLQSKPPAALPTYLEQIPFLDTGQAIYVAANGTTARIKTPKFPDPPPLSYRTEIIEHTSAQIRLKRTGDKPPSTTKNNVPKLEEDDEDIKPGA